MADAANPPSIKQAIPKPPKPAIHLRPATSEDLPRLTSILISSFPADPEWNYRYPYAEQYPDDHYKYTYQRVNDYFANVARGAADMVVAEIEVDDRDHAPASAEAATDQPPPPKRREVIGWACWACPGSHGTPGSDPEREMKFPSVPGERRDAHPGHVAAYIAVMYNKKTTVFDDVYGEKHAHLCLLGVDPGFQGYGAGTALVGDGIEKAKAAGYVLTLFATGPGGRRLYTRMGFREVAWVKVGPGEGESEVIEFPGMVWDAVDNKS